MIEFVLICPLILIIIGYTLRLTQILQAHQIATILSREIATEAFGLCTDITIQDRLCASDAICIDMDTTRAITDECIRKLQDKYQNLWPVMRPASNPTESPATLAVEIYRYDIGNFSPPSDCTQEDRSTRFSTNPEVPAAQILPSSLCRRNRIARARVSFLIEPITAFTNLYGGVIPREVEIIDETIL